ncbi:hypothetical protein Fmac_017132 [Flemingia macrophylla]|uniref:Pentatricopeptide repeat-containing protein n=1 Tax=Flemingia macrophylla TaxID=520843 RepID=A0ABD1M1G9_9FABA
MLDGYSKAGEMNKAFKLFERMLERDIVSWNTLVCGYSKTEDMVMASLSCNDVDCCDENIVTLV